MLVIVSFLLVEKKSEVEKILSQAREKIAKDLGLIDETKVCILLDS